MNKLTMFAVAGVLATCGIARAENSSAVSGVGTTQCGMWLEARNSNSGDPTRKTAEGFVVSWIQGYLSAKNIVDSRLKMVLSVPSYEVISAYLDVECKKTPLKPLYPVVENMAMELKSLYMPGS